jgi:hypothetical protein
MWYCRHEIQFRQALFFSAASIAGAFSGLLAFGIAKMDGVGGLEGWRWIFILEGIVTVLVATFAFWALYDFPETAGFLTEEERAFVVFRLKYQGQSQSRVAQSDEFKWAYVWAAFKDWQIWVNIFVYWGVSKTNKRYSVYEANEISDCLSALRNQPFLAHHYSKSWLQFEYCSAHDCAYLHHCSHSGCGCCMDFRSSWKEESVYRDVPLYHDCWFLDVSLSPLSHWLNTNFCVGVSLPTTQRSSMAEYSLQHVPFTQPSLESSHGWPTTYREVTSEVSVWLFRSVLETLAV